MRFSLVQLCVRLLGTSVLWTRGRLVRCRCRCRRLLRGLGRRLGRGFALRRRLGSNSRSCRRFGKLRGRGRQYCVGARPSHRRQLRGRRRRARRRARLAHSARGCDACVLRCASHRRLRSCTASHSGGWWLVIFSGRGVEAVFASVGVVFSSGDVEDLCVWARIILCGRGVEVAFASYRVIFSSGDVEDLCRWARIILSCGRVEVACARDSLIFSGSLISIRATDLKT